MRVILSSATMSAIVAAVDAIGWVHGPQPSDRYRRPVASAKYSGMTGMDSRSMYSHTSSSVQCSSGWIRMWVPAGKSVLNWFQNSGG